MLILKKEIAISNFYLQLFLFSPLYFVLNFSIHICSLCFLNWASIFLIFSRTVTSICDKLCPGRLKCSPVVLFVIELKMYPLCSEIRSCKLLWLSPMYCILHFLHEIQYTILLVWQFTWGGIVRRFLLL